MLAELQSTYHNSSHFSGVELGNLVIKSIRDFFSIVMRFWVFGKNKKNMECNYFLPKKLWTDAGIQAFIFKP